MAFDELNVGYQFDDDDDDSSDDDNDGDDDWEY